MATIQYDDESVFTVGTGMTTLRPGAGSRRPVFARAGRTLKFVTGNFSFDASYPVGGEDVSDVFQYFASCLGFMFEQPIATGAQTGKFVKVNMSTKKVMLFTNAAPFAEVADTSDQSATVNLRFIAWGI